MLGNLAGYCNFLVSYYISNELIKSRRSIKDIGLFVDRFSDWASEKYRKATHGMSPVLLNSLSNRIEIMVAGYSRDGISQIYVIRNDASEPALVPHLLDIPYHVSGVISVGTYWPKKTADLRPI